MHVHSCTCMLKPGAERRPRPPVSPSPCLRAHGDRRRTAQAASPPVEAESCGWHFWREGASSRLASRGLCRDVGMTGPRPRSCLGKRISQTRWPADVPTLRRPSHTPEAPEPRHWRSRPTLTAETHLQILALGTGTRRGRLRHGSAQHRIVPRGRCHPAGGRLQVRHHRNRTGGRRCAPPRPDASGQPPQSRPDGVPRMPPRIGAESTHGRIPPSSLPTSFRTHLFRG